LELYKVQSGLVTNKALIPRTLILELSYLMGRKGKGKGKGKSSSSEDNDGLVNTCPTLWKVELKDADEPRVRETCCIPSLVQLRFDNEGFGALVDPDKHEVCLYVDMFEAGFRLPFLRIV
jgi:hypothetical protein